MTGIHIIVLFICSILFFTVFLIMKEHDRQKLISDEKDIITIYLNRLKRHIRQTANGFKLTWYLWGLVLFPLLFGIIIFLTTGNGLLSVFSGMIGLLFPEAIIQSIKASNQKKFEERYARSLEQMSSSLRAGLSIAQAVEDTANCKFLHESMRTEYAKMSSDLQMGLTVTETFKRFAKRVNHEDAYDVALAIDIQNEIGGHEADVIKEIAQNINRRMLLRREIKSIFSETTSMIWMMDFISPLCIIGFSISSPSYIDIYFSSGLYMMIFATIILMIVIGIIINHKSIKRITKGV